MPSTYGQIFNLGSTDHFQEPVCKFYICVYFQGFTKVKKLCVWYNFLPI